MLLAGHRVRTTKGLSMKSGGWFWVLGVLLLHALSSSHTFACQVKKQSAAKNVPPKVLSSSADSKSDKLPQSLNTKNASAAPATGEVFDGDAAYAMLKAVVELGPRITGSEAMSKQQDMLRKHFEALGAKVWLHEFPIEHPVSRRKVIVRNMIVTWHPDRPKRIMLCTHFDTRPQADKDPKFPNGKFLGANDGASGVGLFSELGRHMPAIDAKFGVDFVLFDAEEFVFLAGRDPLFVGSTGFANAYKAEPEPRRFTYECAVLIDMIGDKHLDLFWEQNSMRAAESLNREIWAVAEDLKVIEFQPVIQHTINDDHLPLINIAKIPTIDIIDFDFPTPADKNAYWHTQKDTVENCSAESLFKVGSVLLEWIKRRAAK
jgi:peptidase M28-like protein